MKGEIVLLDIYDNVGTEFFLGLSPVDEFLLNIYVGEYTLENQLKDREKFEYCMNCFEEQMEYNNMYNETEKNRVNFLLENFDNLLDNVEYIILAFDEIDNLEFIKENPIVLSKKIVLSELVDIGDMGKILELMDKYKDIKEKVYVTINENSSYVSLLDCYKTMITIKQQAEAIMKLNFSPLETIMYIYDQVRNRVYKEEDENESAYKSRDLSEVLFGDKIVCAGYASIFSAFLNYMNIKNKAVDLDNNYTDRGHERNEVYVRDDKYGIDGVYYFDVTWDSKKEENSNNYLYGYKYFAKTKDQMDKYDEGAFTNKYLIAYSTDMYEKVKKIVKEKNYEELYNYARTINYMSRLVVDHSLLNLLTLMPGSGWYGDINEEEFLKDFEYVFSRYNKEISAEVMIKILNNVRKIEHYQNPDWYPYSLNDIYKVVFFSKWKFEKEHISECEMLLRSLFDEKNKISLKNTFINYDLEIELNKEIKQIELTKTLKLIRNKKPNL